MKYLIRLDDACPTMSYCKWNIVEIILDKYNIKPMVGIIPSNNDPTLNIDEYRESFWEMTKGWQNKGWAIALHGFDHCYISNNPGINPVWKRSEFAGVSLNVQKNKISQGLKILKLHGLNPKYFFSPSHTFDNNTLKALFDASQIRIICDTIAFKPYKSGEFNFIPQQFGHFFKPLINGTWVFCYHPNSMSNKDIEDFELFIKKNKHLFISFSDLDLSNLKSKSLTCKIFSKLYFFYRKLKILKYERK